MPVATAVAYSGTSPMTFGMTAIAQSIRIALQGQSNALGIASRSEISAPPLSSVPALAAYEASGFDRVRIWNPTTSAYERLKLGDNQQAQNPSLFGPEFALAYRWMTTTTGGVLFIDKQTIDGGQIAYFQKGGTWYADMLTMRAAADAWLSANGYTVTPRGFLWVQGESDRTNSAYQADLTKLISDRITDGFLTSTEPRVICQINPENIYYSTTVANAKIAYAAANPSTVTLVSYQNYLNSDQLHLNGRGQVQFGSDAALTHFGAPHIDF